MTNFRLFETERVCRRQFQIWRKWQKAIQTGKKHHGKKRNCSLWALSPFPTVFSKGLFQKGCQKVSLCGNGLKHFGKRENVGYQHFLLFPKCFQKAFSSEVSQVVIAWERKSIFDYNVGKGEMLATSYFLLFLQCLLPFQRHFIIYATF